MRASSRAKIYLAMLVWTVGVASVAYADDDSSADGASSFGPKVNEASGLVLKVPINDRGEEMTEAAETRLHLGATPETTADLRSVFDRGTRADDQPELTDDDVAADSSTSGWYRWRHSGWHSHYYSSYRPSYYWGGNWCNFGRPYYSDYVDGGSYYPAFRYYYYGRVW